MAVSLVVAWWWLARSDSSPLPPKRSRVETRRALGNATWAIGMPVLMVGGLKFGIFTPTEAGVMSATYALLVSAFIYRELSLSALYEAVLNATKTSAVIMLLVAASTVPAWLITVANVPEQVVSLLQPFMDSRIQLMLVIALFVTVIGMALDFAAVILILTPVLMPVVKIAGIDPIYFGVIFMMTAAIGMITPPVGSVLNTVCGVSKISMEDAVKGVVPFLIAEFLILLLLIIFPALVTVPASWFY
jgi:tripartite ATP-independent transporter DctM subunit